VCVRAYWGMFVKLSCADMGVCVYVCVLDFSKKLK